MILKSHAKVNLGLWVKGKRSDGFHELETLMHEIDLADVLELELAQETSLYVDGKAWDESELGENSILAAKAKFEEALGQSCGHWTIHLKKKIPLGSGLGGGSSNAIVFLLYLYSMFEDKVSWGQVDDIAAALGSDTNFFLKGGSAVCRGRGEQIELMSNKSFYFNMIFPDFACSTPKVFSKFSLDAKACDLDWPVLWRELSEGRTRNDLEAACCAAYPDMTKLLNEIRSSVPSCGLSGSGSTLFTLHSDLSERDATYAQLKSLNIDGVQISQAQSYLRA